MFLLCNAEKCSKGGQTGWRKVPVFTQNFSLLNIVRRQKGTGIFDVYHSALSMMPRTEKLLDC